MIVIRLYFQSVCGIEVEADVYENDDLGPVDSKTSFESATSAKSRKSVSSDSRKSIELPDHYFTHHNPDLKEQFQERAL